MRYGAYSSSEVKSSSDDDVKAKSNSSSLGDVSGSRKKTDINIADPVDLLW